jgi:hypothetical protein
MLNLSKDEITKIATKRLAISTKDALVNAKKGWGLFGQKKEGGK